ncbi:MAG: DUF4282 domain-containing protein [Bacillota bacterium]
MFQDFIKFDKMLTPSIIKIIFWVGIVIVALSAIAMIIGGISSPYGGGFQVLMGLITLIIGPLFVRIQCELLIVIFKIYENLVAMNKKLDNE